MSQALRLIKTLWISMADLKRREMDVRFIEEGHVVPHLFGIEGE